MNCGLILLLSFLAAEKLLIKEITRSQTQAFLRVLDSLLELESQDGL